MYNDYRVKEREENKMIKEKWDALIEINNFIKIIKEYQKTACPWDCAWLEIAKERLKRARKKLILG